MNERILVIESNSMINDVIGQQALQSIGYRVQVITDINAAISITLKSAPDLLIVDLNLPGLSGKDFLVALNSKGIVTPVIVIAQKGMEGDILQAFRLGARDFLLWPFKEAELVNAVENVLSQARKAYPTRQDANQPLKNKQQIQSPALDLSEIISVGKKIISTTDQNLLFGKITEGAIKVTQADLGWFLLRDGTSNTLILVAQIGFPPAFADRLNQPWDDGVSSLVSVSGESLSISGEPLKQFKISGLGQAALLVPIKIKKQIIGLLVVMKKNPQAFSNEDLELLEAVGEYASIAMVNARQLYSIQQATEKLEFDKKIRADLLKEVEQELRTPLGAANSAIDHLLEGRSENLSLDQLQALISTQENLLLSHIILESLNDTNQQIQTKSSLISNLNEVVRLSIHHMEHLAQLNRTNILAEYSAQNILVQMDATQLTQVIDGLLTNAIRYSPSGGQINVRVDKMENRSLHISVHDNGTGMDTRVLPRLFEKGFKTENPPVRPFGGLGIKLNLIKEIIASKGGKIWAESQPGRGTIIHISLPLSQ
jgi:signal transduction histidine kinase/DNA-binding response OmpR family regulator